MPFYVTGLDLGQARDYTALGVLHVTGQPVEIAVPGMDPEIHVRADRRVTVEAPPARFQLQHLERLPLGTPYPDIVSHTLRRLQAIPGGSILAVDATGVGAPVIDMFDRSGLSGLVAVTITGGSEVNIDGRHCKVPKRDLVGVLTSSFQEGRFRAAKRLGLARTFMKELKGFHLKVNTQTGHDTYEAWREGVHDDLVLAVAIAAWLAEHELEAAYNEVLAEAAMAEFGIGRRVHISPV